MQRCAYSVVAMALLQLAALLLLAGAPCYAATTKIAWEIPYKGAAEVTAVDGDKVSFTWNTKKPTLKHDVFQIKGAANFKNCVATDKTGTSLSKQLVKSTYITKALAPGTYYYTCSVPGHCAAKQKVKVNVAVKWQAKMTPATVNMTLGQTLYFKWGDTLPHDLNLLKGKVAYDQCNTKPAGISKVLLEDAKGATYKYVPTKKGTYYFACGVPGHCAAGGQKVAVVVN